MGIICGRRHVRRSGLLPYVPRHVRRRIRRLNYRYGPLQIRRLSHFDGPLQIRRRRETQEQPQDEMKPNLQTDVATAVLRQQSKDEMEMLPCLQTLR